MKALIIGYGSMGKRRIRLLQQLNPAVDIICLDSHPERKKQIQADGFVQASDFEAAIASQPELAFVCTPPGNHANIILDLAARGIHVFCELNLTDTGYEEIQAVAAGSHAVVFMSGTMLYDKRIQCIDRFVKQSEKPLAYLYHVGQYLPDWHPWEDYRDVFISREETNGVREIFAVQLPWIIETFGRIDVVSVNSQKCTGLDLAFDDCVIANFRHTNGNIGVFTADTVSRKAVTSMEVFGEDLYLFWQGHNDDLYLFDTETGKQQAVHAYETVQHQEGYSEYIVENRYADEIRDFLDAVYKHKKPKYSLEQDRYTLSIIDQIEEQIKTAGMEG